MEKVKIFTKEMYNLAKVEFPWLNKNTYGLAEEQAKYSLNEKVPYQIHDKTFKIILEDKKIAADFINKALKLKNNKLNSEDLIKEKTEYITSRFRKKEVDVLYRLKERKVYFLIEHQSTIDYLMPYRILEYQIEIMRNAMMDYAESKIKKIPKVIAIVIYTGKRKWNVEEDIKNMQEDFETEAETLGIYNFLDINKFNKDNLLEMDNLVYDMMLIEKSKDTKELEENINRIIKEIKDSKEIMERIIKLIMLPTFGKAKVINLIEKLYKKEGSDNMLQVTRMLNRELKLRHNEGVKEGLLRVAKNLLKKNVDISEIKELTGLSEEEIQKIK